MPVELQCVLTDGVLTQACVCVRADGFAVVYPTLTARQGFVSSRWMLEMNEFNLLRHRIVKHLRAQCGLKYAASVTFADGHALVGGCLSKGQLQFEDCASGSTVSVQADLVVLADGAGSRCRALLQHEVRPTPACCGSPCLHSVNKDAAPSHE
jgi:2-polyprenyl-6-methoxyphenol hydroxylase-like FAD-dependent oxidoreductase